MTFRALEKSVLQRSWKSPGNFFLKKGTNPDNVFSYKTKTKHFACAYYMQCAVPENIHTPHRRDWNFLGGGGGGAVEGSVRSKHLKKCMKLSWNFQRGGGS